jgi:hypothetical protein
VPDRRARIATDISLSFNSQITESGLAMAVIWWFMHISFDEEQAQRMVLKMENPVQMPPNSD